METNLSPKKAEFLLRVEQLELNYPGLHNLIDYLSTQTDFFTAPCSTRFHLCVEEGLVEHSLHVDTVFNSLCDIFYPALPAHSRHLMALLHDVCKANSYKRVKKSRKTGKTLPNGKPEWEDYYGYDFEEDMPYGHGEKSVYIIRTFITLSLEEAMAIRWHMGFSDATFKGGQQTVSSAIKKYPVIALLHAADLIATSMEE